MSQSRPNQPNGPTSPHPIVNAMLICDYATKEKGTGKITLHGIFENIEAAGFPAKHAKLCVYVKLTDAEGIYRFRLTLMHLETAKSMPIGEVDVTVQDRMGSHELTFNLENLVFPWEGLHEFQLHADGRYVGSKTFRVIQLLSPKGGPKMTSLRTLPNEVSPPTPLKGPGKLPATVSKDHPDYRFVFQQIASLGKLKKGWDSYGGAPIPKEAQRRAVAFLGTLLTHIDRRVPPPTVGPSASGGVVLRWVTESYDVILTFLASGGEYSVVDRARDAVVVEGQVGRPETLIRDVVKPFLLG